MEDAAQLSDRPRRMAWPTGREDRCCLSYKGTASCCEPLQSSSPWVDAEKGRAVVRPQGLDEGSGCIGV